jgi:copper(I)-binding protein
MTISYRNIALLALVWVIATPSTAAQLDIRDAWLRAAPPTASTRAAYMQISNPGTEGISLVSASAAQFAKVELHRTTMANGMMRMQRVEVLDIPAQSTVRLEPNGYHLMLISPTTRIDSNAEVTLTLRWSDGTEQAVNVPVRTEDSETAGNAPP